MEEWGFGGRRALQIANCKLSIEPSQSATFRCRTRVCSYGYVADWDRSICNLQFAICNALPLCNRERLPLGVHELVAEAADGAEEEGVVGVGLDLAAETADVDGERLDAQL